MLLGVKQIQTVLRDDAQVVVEHVLLEDLSVSLVLLVGGTGHITDDVEELDQELQG